MIYLLLNIVFASAFTLIIKWAQVRDREDILTIGAINYIVAAVWSLPEVLQIDAGSLDTAAVLTGGAMGLCYFVAFFFVIYAIRLIGAASTSVIGVLSILMPIACGIFIWSEQPNGIQLVGVVLALLSLMLISRRSARKELFGSSSKTEPGTEDVSESESAMKAAATWRSQPWVRPVMLVSFFLLAGIARLAQEAFKHESDPVHRPTFLFVAFAVAAVPSIGLLLARRRRISFPEAGLGFLMGAANILQTHYILKALRDFDSFVVFPASSAGGLLLTTLITTRFLGEQLDRPKSWGIGIAVCALVLLNW